MIETIVLEKNNDFVKGLSERLAREEDINVTVVASPDQAEASAKHRQTAILVIGPTAKIESAVALAERLGGATKDVGCLLVADEITTVILQRAMRAGFRDVVGNDVDEILAAVRRAYKPIALQAGDKGQETAQGRVITFFSTKGGVGKTVFAVNTAVGLARQKKGSVVLLDLDTQFGDVGVMLGFKPEKTLADIIPSIDRLDADLLSGFLSRHASGCQVLLAPVHHETADRLPQHQLRKIIDTARVAADFVIVDTPAVFSDSTLTILDNSDCICLVTTLDVPSVKNTQIALQTLELLNYPESKIKVLLNRADSKVALLPSEVEKHLKHKIDVQIPSNLAVPRTVNEGAPLLTEDQRIPVAAALNKIVDLAAEIRPYQSLEKKTGKVT